MSTKQLTRENYAIQTTNLTKQFGSFIALEGCTVQVPVGSITALIGPHGAGKTTLLKLITSLSTPSSGRIQANGEAASQAANYISKIGYLAQNIPLYKDLTVADHIQMGAAMNQTWNSELVNSRMKQLRIPLERKAGVLSGGQRAQLGLALTLAKQPQLLLLDEPVAALDPLARKHFLTAITQTMSDSELTIVMSSHLLTDLELVADYVVLLTPGHVAIQGNIDDITNSHWLLIGNAAQSTPLPTDLKIITDQTNDRQRTLVVHTPHGQPILPGWQIEALTLETNALAYMEQADVKLEED